MNDRKGQERIKCRRLYEPGNCFLQLLGHSKAIGMLMGAAGLRRGKVNLGSGHVNMKLLPAGQGSRFDP